MQDRVREGWGIPTWFVWKEKETRNIRRNCNVLKNGVRLVSLDAIACISTVYTTYGTRSLQYTLHNYASAMPWTGMCRNKRVAWYSCPCNFGIFVGNSQRCQYLLGWWCVDTYLIGLCFDYNTSQQVKSRLQCVILYPHYQKRSRLHDS